MSKRFSPRPLLRRSLVASFVCALLLASLPLSEVAADAQQPGSTERLATSVPFLPNDQRFGSPSTIDLADLVFNADQSILEGVQPTAYKKYWDLALGHHTPITLDLSQTGITEVQANAVNELPIHILKLPASLQTIGSRAFADNLITEVHYPGDATTLTVGSDAFTQAEPQPFLNNNQLPQQKQLHNFNYNQNFFTLRWNTQLNQWTPLTLYTPLYYQLNVNGIKQENPFKLQIGDNTTYGKITPIEYQVPSYRKNINTTHLPQQQNPTLELNPTYGNTNNMLGVLADYEVTQGNITLKGTQYLIRNQVIYLDIENFLPNRVEALLDSEANASSGRQAILDLLKMPTNTNNSLAGFATDYYLSTWKNQDYVLVSDPQAQLPPDQADAILGKINAILQYSTFMPSEPTLNANAKAPAGWLQGTNAELNQNEYRLIMSGLEKKNIDYAFLAKRFTLTYRYFDVDTGNLVGSTESERYVGGRFPEPLAPEGYALLFNGEQYFDAKARISSFTDPFYNIPVRKGDANPPADNVTLEVVFTNQLGLRLGPSFTVKFKPNQPLVLTPEMNAYFDTAFFKRLNPQTAYPNLTDALDDASKAKLGQTYAQDSQIVLVIKDEGAGTPPAQPNPPIAPTPPSAGHPSDSPAPTPVPNAKGQSSQAIPCAQSCVGARGPAGPEGKMGPKGTDGRDGKDGQSPHIGANGNWFIGLTDTGVAASPTTRSAGGYLWWPVILLALCVLLLAAWLYKTRRDYKQHVREVDRLLVLLAKAQGLDLETLRRRMKS